ncbi:MAG: homocysteine S-methyltransferase family protein [Coriobacteriia bacterium]|nr:homocysteine S-methyltransferase family protein [Coriobacteriia bacterium]
MPDIGVRLGREVLVIDGAMGTMLQRAGVPPEQCHEQLNVTAPEIVEQVHRDYVIAGADCITTNTFGGTRAKLDEYGLGDQARELNRAAVRIARRSGAQHVLASMGPTGLVPEPLGDATFGELFELFAEQARALAEEGPDAFIVETMTDVAEARCAVFAARSAAPDLPVIASVTFGLSGRTDLSGTDPATAAVVLEAAGAAAVGMNCGLGPEQMLPLVRAMAAATALPVAAQPNAGLPCLEEGRTVFPGTPDETGSHAALFVEAGATLVGSCCGSTPAFTGAISDLARRVPLPARQAPAGVALAGPRASVRIGPGLPLAIIGERINPTGKKALADSLRAGSMSVVREYAVAQQHAGADLLDVNVGAAGVEAAEALPAAVKALVALADLPLVLDTTDAVALERSLKLYPGRALVNSVDGSPDSLRTVLPLAARYGAAVVALCLDDDGIPDTVEGRMAVLDRIREAARGHGMSDRDVVADCLTLSAAADPRAAQVTVEAVWAAARERGLATVLGVSNVSHGLPGRSALNAAFLEMAAAAGLASAIAEAADREVARAAAAANALLGRDPRAEVWIARAAPRGPEEPGGAIGPGRARERAAAALAAAVENGDRDGAPLLVDDLLAAGIAADAVIRGVLTPAIQRLGDAFGRGETFLPQLMAAAEAMKAAVARVKEHLPAEAAVSEGRVAFATVKGDIHSIGKDICVSLLESQGFDVDDLGADVPAEQVAEAARSADVVCLSALMTTTLPRMEEAVRAVRAAAPGIPVLVGGAVVTAEYASALAAGYAADAPGCVEAVRAAVRVGT